MVDIRGITNKDDEKSRKLNFNNIDTSLRSIVAELKKQSKFTKSVESTIAEAEDRPVVESVMSTSVTGATNASLVIGSITFDKKKDRPTIISGYGNGTANPERRRIAELLTTTGIHRISIYLRRDGVVLTSLASIITNSSAHPATVTSLGQFTYVDYDADIGEHDYDLQIVNEGSTATFDYYPFVLNAVSLG